MTFAKFILASEWEQEHALEEAVYLMQRKQGKHLYMLFQLKNFYVEKVFNERRELEQLNAFDTLCLLDPYLELINVTDQF